MTRGKRTWLVYWLCVAGMALTLCSVTIFALYRESENDKYQSMFDSWLETRVALSFMDAWLAPILAAEAARPPAEFEEGKIPRDLPGAEPGLFRLHFTVGSDDVFRTPTPAVADLERLRARVTADALRQAATLDPGYFAATRPTGTPVVDEGQTAQFQVEHDAQSAEDFRLRQFAFNNAVVSQSLTNSAANDGPPRPFVPLWLRADAAGHPDDLVLVRATTPGPNAKLLGILVDWPALRVALKSRSGIDYADSGLELVPAEDARDQTSTPQNQLMLATAPICLQRSQGMFSKTRLSPRHYGSRLALLAAWASVLASMFALSRLLKSSSDLAERRGRFVSAVTHELRTPLTTFRMYSEMLAQDMVADPATRQQYLETLESESGRLARVVESVLLYARLEEGKAGARREHIVAGAMFDRVLPVLERRAAAGEMTLACAFDPGARDAVVDADAQAVEQILHNLVDNACKYAGSAQDRTVTLHIACDADRLRITVGDAGPGVAPTDEAAIFEPFRRAARDEPGPVPGAGLGLAIARSLARALDGDLVLLPTTTGASFSLTLVRTG